MTKFNINALNILIIILLTALFIHPLFQLRFYESHDSDAHAARFAAYYQAFQDGQIPPRWAGNLNFGYGTPIFIFYYPLPGYLASALHSVNISYEHAFLILMIISFLAGPVFFYLWVKEYLNKQTAFAGAILYALVPYHFLNTYIRGDVAENIAIALIPLVFYFIERFLKTKNLTYIIYGGISYALLVLSHNGVSLMFSPVLLLYVLLRSRSKKYFLNTSMIFLLGLLISAYFWLPALYEGKYVNTSLFIGNMYKNHFPTLQQLIYSNWGFGTNVSDANGLSPQIGLVNLLLVLGGIYALFRKKSRKDLLFWIFIFFSGIFISLSLSDFVWSMIPTLRLYEFPWRFTSLTSFAAVVIGCLFIASINIKFRFLIFLLVVVGVFSFQFIRIDNYISRNDNYYDTFKGTTYYHGEASTIWTQGDPGESPKSSVELIGGKAKIEKFQKRTNKISFKVNALTKAQFLVNVVYFPGWSVKVNGNKIPIEFQDMNHRGFITFYLSQGRHDIVVEFLESPVRFMSNILSVSGIIISVILVLLVKLRKLPARL